MPKEEFMNSFPPSIRWKADNLNHLMEQPTYFLALCLSLSFLQQGSGLNAYLAWAYVALRVIHSIVQSTINNIMLRFSIFIAGSVVLAVLAIRAALVVFF